MPLVIFFCRAIYKIRVGSITMTRPAYILPYCAAAFCAFIRFISPTGRVFTLFSVMRVMAIIYSFQNARKLNSITVIIPGLARGTIIFQRVRLLVAEKFSDKSYVINETIAALTVAVSAIVMAVN